LKVLEARQGRTNQGILTGYNLDLAFLKEGEGEPKIKKWVMEFHEKRATTNSQAK
jgi:hypothetical protein